VAATSRLAIRDGDRQVTTPARSAVHRRTEEGVHILEAPSQVEVAASMEARAAAVVVGHTEEVEEVAAPHQAAEAPTSRNVPHAPQQAAIRILTWRSMVTITGGRGRRRSSRKVRLSASSVIKSSKD
jgi:hypothetical protein